MKISQRMVALATVIIAIASCPEYSFSQVTDALSKGFSDPPDESRPRVWWHWMNGNVTKKGINEDLHWMKRIGVGGFQNFDAGLATPLVVDKRLVYMTPEWKDAFRYTAQLADSLGLEMAIAGSPGWSESGGPWVPAKDGMKKYVWSETRIKGGQKFSGTLQHPPSTTGTFQGMPVETEARLSAGVPETHEYYKDIAVVAYKIPDADIAVKSYKPVITSSGGAFNLDQLIDGDVAHTSYLPPEKVGEYAWVQFDFGKSVTLKSLRLAGGGMLPQFSTGLELATRFLEESNDGKNYRKVMDLPLGRVIQSTFVFKPVTARYYRINFLTEEPKGNRLLELLGVPQPKAAVKGFDIAEIDFSTVSSIDRFEEKAAFGINRNLHDLYSNPTPATDAAIRQEEVIDLSTKLKADGSIEWTAPAGNWCVLRFGYSLTGSQNHPASPEATGLEVDKLDPNAVRSYIENYLDQYKNASGGLIGNNGALKYVVTDSWEAGSQNWTEAMPEEFRKRRGYSMIPWMPVLAGKIVQNAETSDKFLWDFRQTLAEMVKEYHYDMWTEVLHAKGLGRYSESHEAGRAFIGDGMAVKSRADVPMSAMWTPGALGGSETDGPAVKFQTDIMESASVSHLYGQKFVAAESMTAIGNAWAYSPERLKPTADMELASGLNRFVIHCSVHQPVDDKIPGLGLGPFGQWFTRHETWAEQARPWMDYLARSCYMLQQGKFVADFVYFYGEDNNLTALYSNKLPDMPAGYSYDFINSDGLIDLLSVKNGKLVTPSGMSYHVLVLGDNTKNMSLKVLKKINELVKAGAVVAGAKPEQSPGLQDNVAAFNTLLNQAWTAGKIYATTQQALIAIGLQPDFIAPDNNANKIRFIHRRSGDADIYWVSNRNNTDKDITTQFRVNGKAAEIWHPETGAMEAISYKTEKGITSVPLHFGPNEAFFIVFRKATATQQYTAVEKKVVKSMTVDGDWQLSFQQARGAGEPVTLNRLESWTEQNDKGIRYFSGTATYIKNITIAEDWLNKDSEIWIDLGSVKNIAEVIVNGQSQRILWRTPFNAEISKALKAGENKLEIKVTNLWVNRLIGDQQPDMTHKITYTTMPFYNKDSQLLPSGLLGPVKLIEKR